jgi:hypothetical protein
VSSEQLTYQKFVLKLVGCTSQWLYTGRMFCTPVDKELAEAELGKLLACYRLGTTFKIQIF